MKKGCLIISAIGFVLVLVVVAVLFLVFRMTAPVVAEGDRFLAALGSGSPEAAYEMGSSALRSGQTREDFARTVKAYGLDGFQSATWSNRQIRNDRGLLEGTAHTKSGGAIPLKLELIKEAGQWKVLSVQGPQAGASTGPVVEATEADPQTPAASQIPVPAGTDAARLALSSLVPFNEAVQAKSFEGFHAGLAKLWRDQITPAKLLEIFQPFIDAEIDLTPIQSVMPVFATPPAVNADGVLVLDGHYPTTPNKVYFTLKYVEEAGAWKLVGINVNVDE